MEMPRENELGAKSVGRLLFNMSVPAITAQIVNVLYNIVDRMYIGHIPEIGADALTGVGGVFVFMIFFIIQVTNEGCVI